MLIDTFYQPILLMFTIKNEDKMQYTNGLRTVITCAVVISSISFYILISGCALENKIAVNDVVVTEQPFEEWINQEFHPEPPQAIGFNEPSDWSGWNKFWFASAVGGQAADVISTQSAINRGCIEANPLYGDHPSTGTMILVKAALLGIGYTTTEYWLADHPAQQDFRNWVYGAFTLIGFGAAGLNSGQGCN